jgi:hypothetical protein
MWPKPSRNSTIHTQWRVKFTRPTMGHSHNLLYYSHTTPSKVSQWVNLWEQGPLRGPKSSCKWQGKDWITALQSLGFGKNDDMIDLDDAQAMRSFISWWRLLWAEISTAFTLRTPCMEPWPLAIHLGMGWCRWLLGWFMALVFTVLDDVLFQNQNCPLPTSPVRVDINSLSTEKARHAAVRFPSACPVLLRLDGVGPLVALVFVSSWRHSQDCQGCCPTVPRLWLIPNGNI